MKNCHKRWKREKKEEERRLQESSEQAKKDGEATLYFFQKHPDQAIYEMGLYTKGEATGSISKPMLGDISSDKPTPPIPARW